MIFMNRTSVILLLGLIIAASGCTSTESPELQKIHVDAEEADTNLSGQEILNSSIKKIKSTESHRTNSTNQLALSASVFSLDIDMDTIAALNYTSKTSESSIDGKITAGASYIGTNTTDFNSASYTDENSSYVKRANRTENSTGEWTQYDSGFDQNPATLQTRLLKDSEAKLLGTDTVNGNETYLLSLENMLNASSQHFSQVFLKYGSELSGRSEETEGVDEENVDSTQTYLWIDQESMKPVRFSYFISVDVKSNEEGLFNADGSMQIKSQNTYTAYNQKQNIRIPEEVR